MVVNIIEWLDPSSRIRSVRFSVFLIRDSVILTVIIKLEAVLHSLFQLLGIKTLGKCFFSSVFIHGRKGRRHMVGSECFAMLKAITQTHFLQFVMLVLVVVEHLFKSLLIIILFLPNHT